MGRSLIEIKDLRRKADHFCQRSQAKGNHGFVLRTDRDLAEYLDVTPERIADSMNGISNKARPPNLVQPATLDRLTDGLIELLGGNVTREQARHLWQNETADNFRIAIWGLNALDLDSCLAQKAPELKTQLVIVDEETRMVRDPNHIAAKRKVPVGSSFYLDMSEVQGGWLILLCRVNSGLQLISPIDNQYQRLGGHRVRFPDDVYELPDRGIHSFIAIEVMTRTPPLVPFKRGIDTLLKDDEERALVSLLSESPWRWGSETVDVTDVDGHPRIPD